MVVSGTGNLGSPFPQKDRFRISGNWVVATISGQPVSISGQPVSVNISGIIVQISGIAVEISGDAVTISGQPVTISGQPVIAQVLATKDYFFEYAPASSPASGLLISGEIMVSTPVPTSGYTRIIGSVYSDVPGVLKIEQAVISGFWDASSPRVVVTSGTGHNYSVTVTNKYARVKYISEDDQQSSFRLSATLCAL